jgi:peptidoglycan/LPS O-acetylase OafA/YrhL
LSSEKFSRLHGLDTLRAIAIVSVMIFHLQGSLPNALQWIENLGWMGVDLFFVLSGFLIGSQLLRSFVVGKPLDVRGFYLRRAYRILPAYLVVVLLYLAVPIWREKPGLPAAWKFLTFTANLVMNYPAELAFSHSWSLCIEEHFYLVLPWIVLWQMRRPSVWKAVALVVSVVIGGVLVRSWGLFHVVHASGVEDSEVWPVFMKRIYYPTYSRLDGLVCGVVLASVVTLKPRWWAKVSDRGWSLLVAGLLVFGTEVWAFRGEYPSPDNAAGALLGFPLVSVGLGLLVASAVASNGPLRVRVPGAKVLATLAFSLYLTHKEVAHVDRVVFPWLDGNNGWVAAGVYAATCLAFAGLLYLCVERPFLMLRDRQLRRSVVREPGVEARLDPAL